MLTKGDNLQAKIRQLYQEAEEREAKRIAEKHHVNYANLIESPISVDAMKFVPEEKAKALSLGIFQLKAERGAVAVLNPSDPKVVAYLSDLGKQYQLQVFVVSKNSMDHLLSYYKFIPKASGQITGKI